MEQANALAGLAAKMQKYEDMFKDVPDEGSVDP
jgi:hypothetical protein